MFGQPIFDAGIQPYLGEVPDEIGYTWSDGYGTQAQWAANESAGSSAYPNSSALSEKSVIGIPQSVYRNGNSNVESVPAAFACAVCSKTFNNLSEYNKHKKQHTRPYECDAEGCNQAFSQQQQLDRHNQARHDIKSKYYHCTTEGCKYSYTSKSAKNILRQDHMKAHIKQSGHYGPHSPCERKKVAKKAALCITIRILFEEWKLDDVAEKKRVLKTAYISSSRTPLWYPDIVDKAYILQSFDLKGGFHCEQPGCYFNLGAGGLQPLAFRLESDLAIHKRRTVHQPYELIAEKISQSSVEDQCNLDITVSNVAYPKDDNVLDPAQQAKKGLHPQWPKKNQGLPEFPMSLSNNIDPIATSNASLCGTYSRLGHTSSIGSELFPWSWGSVVTHESESVHTATQPRYKPYSENLLPMQSVNTEFEFDASSALAGTGAWDVTENETAIQKLLRQERQLTIDSTSDGTSFSTSSSAIFSDAGFFSESGEYLIQAPPHMADVFGYKDWDWQSPNFLDEILQRSDSAREEEGLNSSTAEKAPAANAILPVSDLQLDIRTEAKLHRTPCSECGKDFARSRDMNRHFKMCHEAIIHKCLHEGCGREFPRVDKLRKHQITTHELSTSMTE